MSDEFRKAWEDTLKAPTPEWAKTLAKAIVESWEATAGFNRKMRETLILHAQPTNDLHDVDIE